jgi:LPXTG-motif cell wall-anchored protein
MNTLFRRSAATLAVLLGIYIIVPPSISSAATKVDLGVASSFGVLGAATITNTGPTVISGTAGSEIGVSGGSAITGFPPGTAGVVHSNDATAATALAAAVTAAGVASSEPSIAHTLVPGESLSPGAYALGTLTSLTGTLTLNGGGDPNAVFVFTTTSSLTTASSSVVTLTNGTQACNVFWEVGSSATLGTNSTFVGHVVALASITATTGASVQGSLFARTGAVTLDSNVITNDNCAPVPVPVAVSAPVQGSSISSVTPATCVTSGPTTVTLNGSFPAAITNITINGTILPANSWVQTSSAIVITSPIKTTSAAIIQLYNGDVPLLAVQSFICEPTTAVDTTITPVVVPAVPTITTGTIHVIKVVNNTYGGTATPGDFILTLRHHGTDVAGSPAVGEASPGRTYILAPGTYVLGEEDSAAFPNYIQSFDIAGESTQFINLLAGQSLTIVQTNNELPALTASVTPTTPATPTTPTETGGLLPKTGSPWFNLLIIGVLAMALSGVVLGLKRSPKH